ncbi:MAG TPA: hypothetical protein VFZ61_18115, partial [Polyangiales bacterium]
MNELLDSLQYQADLRELGPELGARFAPLAPDAELAAWLRQVGDAPHGRLKTTLVGWLDGVASSYDVHGWLGAYPMYLLGSAAWGQLLNGAKRERLLDVGAGAG